MKITTINGRNIITADEGKVPTDGTTYGTQIYLAEGVNPYIYYEVPKEEYLKAQEEERAKAEQMMA